MMNIPSQNIPNGDLNRVVQGFQLYAMSGLGGPALWGAEMAKLADARIESYKAMIDNLQQCAAKDMAAKQTQLSQFEFKLPTTQRPPIMLQPDSQYEQGEYLFDGEVISCFKIGGERRLCLPQLLKTVFHKFSLYVIEKACDDLNVYYQRCNAEQLDLFKQTGKLPQSADACGLITLTDAERLCTALVPKEHDCKSYNNNNNTLVELKDSAVSGGVPVYHECFGEGRGYLRPELYYSSDAPCIECADCGTLFSTRRFVGHSHKTSESGLCHWGFDRNNWRSYILFDEEVISDKDECDKMEEAFELTLQRFKSERNATKEDRKRKISLASNDRVEETYKARRFSDGQLPVMPQRLSNLWLQSPPLTFPLHNAVTSPWPSPVAANLSPQLLHKSRTPPVAVAAPKSRLPTQRSCPPTLENPDRVVPSCESSRYEKHFVPNIALQQSNEDELKVDDNEFQVIKTEPKNDDNCLPTALTSPGSITSSRESTETYQTVIENLAKMEMEYLKVLDITNLSQSEKVGLRQKYASYTDAIRRECKHKDMSLSSCIHSDGEEEVDC